MRILSVIPAKAGIQTLTFLAYPDWTPTFAGMTIGKTINEFVCTYATRNCGNCQLLAHAHGYPHCYPQAIHLTLFFRYTKASFRI